MPVESPRSPSGDLCSECGLCCNGWLFRQTHLSQADVDAIRDVAAIVATPKGPALPQPCAFHTGSACRIHATRPHRCRGFSCASLTAYERGALPIDEARRRLRGATDAIAVLAAELRVSGWTLPGEADSVAWQRFKLALEGAPDPVAFRRANAQTVSASAAASIICQLALGDYF